MYILPFPLKRKKKYEKCSKFFRSMEFCHSFGQSVSLAIRNREKNEDESGASTIKDGATAYFVFPGESGADASWLMGADFAAKADLGFEGHTTGSFVLRPHIHRVNGN